MFDLNATNETQIRKQHTRTASNDGAQPQNDGARPQNAWTPGNNIGEQREGGRTRPGFGKNETERVRERTYLQNMKNAAAESSPTTGMNDVGGWRLALRKKKNRNFRAWRRDERNGRIWESDG
ncbi:PolC-type DNA-polymerase III [Sesbania bispinosa]|nr:PolC-type DNA-polymerase III [Sesbania bispinosa]